MMMLLIMRRIVGLLCSMLVLASLCAATTATAIHTQGERVVADTECGKVRGVLNSTTHIASFKGIPYAAPPTGERRWASPVSRKAAGLCWGPNKVYDAQEFGPFCVQSGQFQQDGEENCLFLNVWQPNYNQAAEELLPVMVYLYGGDLTDGRTNSYAMDHLVKQGNVVAVSMNYRLNLFGFLATKELSEVSWLSVVKLRSCTYVCYSTKNVHCRQHQEDLQEIMVLKTNRWLCAGFKITSKTLAEILLG